MIYKIVYNPYAERDMWEIADYFSEHSVSAAQKFLRNLKEKIEGLSEMPLRYPKINSQQEYRKMAVDKYVVVYLVNEHQKKVLIIRVVNGMRDYQSDI